MPCIRTVIALGAGLDYTTRGAQLRQVSQLQACKMLQASARQTVEAAGCHGPPWGGFPAAVPA